MWRNGDLIWLHLKSLSQRLQFGVERFDRDHHVTRYLLAVESTVMTMQVLCYSQCLYSDLVGIVDLEVCSGAVSNNDTLEEKSLLTLTIHPNAFLCQWQWPYIQYVYLVQHISVSYTGLPVSVL